MSRHGVQGSAGCRLPRCAACLSVCLRVQCLRAGDGRKSWLATERSEIVKSFVQQYMWLDPAAEWASQCFFTARSEYWQERVPAGANQSLVRTRVYGPFSHFCRKYVQYSTALPFFLDSGGLRIDGIPLPLGIHPISWLSVCVIAFIESYCTYCTMT